MRILFEPDGSEVKGASLSFNISSQTDYEITEGLVKENGTLICSFNDRTGEASQVVEVTTSTVKISNSNSDEVVSDLDFSMSSSQQTIISSSISKNKMSEKISSKDAQVQGVNTLLSLSKGNCDIESGPIKESDISANINLVNETGSNNLYGCCIEKSKLESGSSETEETE